MKDFFGFSAKAPNISLKILAVGLISCASSFPERASASVITGELDFDVASLVSIDWTANLIAHPSEIQSGTYALGFGPASNTYFSNLGVSESHGTTSRHGMFASWIIKPNSNSRIAIYTIAPLAEISPNCPGNDPSCGPVSASTSIGAQSTAGVTFDPVKNLATAVQSGNEVPGPLPLFGIGAAWGYSRKLRKLINV